MSAFVRVDTTGHATIIMPYVALAAAVVERAARLVADELCLSLDRIAVDHDAAERERTGMPRTRIADLDSDSERALVLLAAAARSLLTAAAAERWDVAPAKCRAERGAVLDPGGKRGIPYGQVAADAALLELPSAVRLRSDAWTALRRAAE